MPATAAASTSCCTTSTARVRVLVGECVGGGAGHPAQCRQVEMRAQLPSPSCSFAATSPGCPPASPYPTPQPCLPPPAPGTGLRDAAAQRQLSRLASLPRVHLAATVDHANAALLWDLQTKDRFAWVWHNATTYAPYLREVGFAGERQHSSRVVVVWCVLGCRRAGAATGASLAHALHAWPHARHPSTPAHLGTPPSHLPTHPCTPHTPTRRHPLAAGRPQRAVQQAERHRGVGLALALCSRGVPPCGRRPARSLRFCCSRLDFGLCWR